MNPRRLALGIVVVLLAVTAVNGSSVADGQVTVDGVSQSDETETKETIGTPSESLTLTPSPYTAECDATCVNTGTVTETE